MCISPKSQWGYTLLHIKKNFGGHFYTTFIQKFQLVHVYMAFLYAILNLLYVLNNNKDSTEALLGVREWFWREGFKGAVEGSRGAVEGSRGAVEGSREAVKGSRWVVE